MINSNEKIVAIVPAYNETGKIGKVVSKILSEKIVHRVIVVDDGSKDSTSQEAESSGARVLKHEKNSGVGSAIRTALDHARKEGYTIAVVLGGDDQDNPNEICRLLTPISNDHFAFVQGSRYLSGGVRENIPLFRRITTGFFSFLFKIIIRFPVTDGTNGFRAFRLSILDHPGINIHQKWLDKYELEPYLYYKTIELGMNVTEIPVTKRYPKDKIGYTKMVPILDWWSILRPLIYLRLGLKK